MTKMELATKDRIINVAKKHFLEKNFKDASLRQIVKEAGVTTGAFYGYFDSKEAVFEAIVDEIAQDIIEDSQKMLNDFESMDYNKKLEYMMMSMEKNGDHMIEYVMKNHDALLLLFTAEGTGYNNFIEKMIELEVPSIMIFLREHQDKNPSIEPIDEGIVCLMLHSFYVGFLKIVKMELDNQTAKHYLNRLAKFHQAGWRSLLSCE